MADATTGLGGISKDGTDPHAAGVPQPQATPETEVRILEERVTHAAQKPSTSAQESPASPSTSQARPVAPVPAPVASAVPPKVNPPPQAAQFDPIAEDVGLVLPPRDKPAPKIPPALQPPVSPNLGEPALGDDIAKILAEVKLPERRDAAPSNNQRDASQGGQKKFDTSIVGSVLQEEEKVAGPTVASPTHESANPDQVPSMVTSKEAEKNAGGIVAIHTLKDDLQGVVHDKKISLVRAVSLEEDRRTHKASEIVEISGVQQRSRRTFGIIFTVLILLGLGAAALFGVAFIMNQKQSPPQIDAGSSILFAEQSVLLSLDTQSPGELKRMLEAGRTASQGTLGSITRIIPVTTAKSADGTMQNRAATFKEFMSAIGAHPPDDLLRALESDFFLGIHVVDESAPILVIPVVSYDHAFAAMLEWEGSLNTDLAPAFTAVSILTLDKNGLPVRRTYEDLVMRNYDVRVLKDDAGTIQLYYSFPTQNILILAESPYSFPEILSRLQAGRRL